VVDDKTVAQTKLNGDLKEAVWDDIFTVDVPLYSQFIKAAAVGQKLVLCLKVIACRDLEAMDISGSSDPYVRIQIGNTINEKTRTVSANLNPDFDEDFDVILDDMSMPLHISVWDVDLLSSDDLIGQVLIRLDELMDVNPDKLKGSFNQWFTIKRDHVASGDVQLGFSFKAPDNESPQTEKELGSTTIDVSRMIVGEEQVSSCFLLTCRCHTFAASCSLSDLPEYSSDNM